MGERGPHILKETRSLINSAFTLQAVLEKDRSSDT